MKKFNILILLIPLLAFCQLNAQNTRYLDPIFETISIESDVIFASNISILSGPPQTVDLLMDVYTPAGDDETSRPVFVILHSGDFFPPYFNGKIIGSRLDSAVVNTCKRLASRGYVAVAAGYRLGWAPFSIDQDVLTGSLLNATYRGIQDVYTCVRFLRKSVAANGNPYGIDPDKVAVLGFGTGGYLALGAGFLDRAEETYIDKFTNSVTEIPYINPLVIGDPYGLVEAPMNIANHVPYDSKASLVVNLSGALGDISWMEGKSDEPAAVGFHVVSDPSTPYVEGAITLPGTGTYVLDVHGTWTVVNQSNLNGNNDILAPVNDLDNPLNQIVNFYKTQQIVHGEEVLPLTVDNLYPFITPGPEAGPWDWWDKATLDIVIPQVNALTGQNFNSDLLHNANLGTNPNMGPEQGKAYLDTVFMYMLPRACNALELESCMTVGVNNPVNEKSVAFKVIPDPADEYFTIYSKAETPILNVYLFDVNGKVIRSYLRIDNSQLTIYREHLPSGIYFVKVKFKEGWLSQKVVFR